GNTLLVHIDRTAELSERAPVTPRNSTSGWGHGVENGQVVWRAFLVDVRRHSYRKQRQIPAYRRLLRHGQAQKAAAGDALHAVFLDPAGPEETRLWRLRAEAA